MVKQPDSFRFQPGLLFAIETDRQICRRVDSIAQCLKCPGSGIGIGIGARSIISRYVYTNSDIHVAKKKIFGIIAQFKFKNLPKVTGGVVVTVGPV